MELTHFNENGRARMVDVGDKMETKRTALARGYIQMSEGTRETIKKGGIKNSFGWRANLACTIRRMGR